MWAADITYIPMARGFAYLTAIMDVATRRLLAWRLSNSLDTRFCLEALTEALERFGRPEIFKAASSPHEPSPATWWRGA